MKDSNLNLISDVIISGDGFALGVSFSTLPSAEDLVSQLFKLRVNEAVNPFPIYNDDDRLAGFVVPSYIRAVVIQNRSGNQPDLHQLHADVLKAQKRYFESHTDGDSDWKK